MIKLGNPILVSDKIADTTAVIIFNNEELIITEVGNDSYGHKLFKSQNELRWTVKYFIESNICFQTRDVLFEKYKKKLGYFYCNYDFYEPVKVLGKGSELKGYEELFYELKERNSIFTPEKTLILKRV